MTHRVARVAVTNARLPPLDCHLQWRELRRYVSTVVLLQLLNIMNINFIDYLSKGAYNLVILTLYNLTLP
jgi:hypothetical protein